MVAPPNMNESMPTIIAFAAAIASAVCLSTSIAFVFIILPPSNLSCIFDTFQLYT